MTIDPNELMQQGARYETEGLFDKAEQTYRHLLTTAPRHAPAWHALGIVALHQGDTKTAIQHISQAVLLDNDQVLYLRNLGELYRRLELFEQAIKFGKLAVKLAPRDIDANYNLGLAYSDAKDFGRAVKCYRKALKHNPKHGLSWNNLGTALEKQGKMQEALAAYRQAVKLNAGHAEAQNNLGAILSEQGDLDEARSAFNRAIDAQPDFIDAHYNLCSLKTYVPDDPQLAMLESMHETRHRLAVPKRVHYLFALGKALDDLGQHDRAFSAYDSANRLQYALQPMDEARADRILDAIVTTFDRDFFQQRNNWRTPAAGNRTPVFIVGMPRSGTSLLEQILATHPQLHGAGELVVWNEAIHEVCGSKEDQCFAYRVPALGKNDLRRMGSAYIDRVWKLSPDSRFISDKMPANFFYLGLIYLALPHARVIHAMRDPMDSCFSCYTRFFSDTMEFSYDQEALGRYYVRYIKLMQHWRKVLPQEFILDLPYEAMVNDTENQARRVLDFVGLPWDAGCLEFYKSKRIVKTASIAQVRQPIYRSSVARWRHFAKHLQPLFDIVKDYRSAQNDLDVACFAGRTEEIRAAGEHTPLATPADTGSVTPAAHSKAVDHLLRQCHALQQANGHQQILTLLEQYAAELARAPALLYSQGVAFYRLKQFDAAKASYGKALALDPGFAEAWNGLGFVLQDMGAIEEAHTAFLRSTQIKPDYEMARVNLALAQLKLGDWEAGWENYESRWLGSAESAKGQIRKPDLPLPQWHGQAGTRRQNLLILTEQGFGDTFQFSRYLVLCAGRFSKVGFVCLAPALRLMEWSFGDQLVLFNCMPGDFATWDYYCPLMSLPKAFATRPQSLPATVPYLKVPRIAQQHWAQRLDAAAPGGFKVGIAWAGRESHVYNQERNIPFAQLLPLLNDRRITWVNLQKWTSDATQANIPPGVDWIDWSAELTDFADTAALIGNLDLVISVDSAIVHLAGALAKPVWMMNRFNSEWRWGVKQETSPWYPSLKLFNQTEYGDWGGVIDRMRAALLSLPIRDRPVPEQYGPAADAPAVHVHLTAEKALVQANQFLNSGRYNEAEHLLRNLIERQPLNAHAVHLLGVVVYHSGDPSRGCELVSQAIAMDAQVALFHANLTEMLRQQGRFEEAIAHGLRAIDLDPLMPAAFSNFGIALYDVQQYDRAEEMHGRALALDAGSLKSINNLGSIERARKNKAGAKDWYRKALAIDPNEIESMNNLSAVLIEEERVDEAIPLIETVLQRAPDYAEAICNLGLARLLQERLDEADELLKRALKRKPSHPEALIGLARVLKEKEQFADVLLILEKLLAQDAGHIEARRTKAAILMETGKEEQARQLYQDILSIVADDTDALNGLANLQLEAGNFGDAERLLEQAVAIKADDVGTHFHLTQARKVTVDDENLAALNRLAAQADQLSVNKRITLYYGLGKAYDDLEEYDKAFGFFIKGAALKRGKLTYSADDDENRINRIIKLFTPDFYRRFRQAKTNRSQLPVFVLGMPRSGTTLTEQIIASHPDVFGAGELNDLFEIVQRTTLPYPDNLVDINGRQLLSWGDEYVARLSTHAADAKRITDKMPANYLALGLIHLMLPNAKIIHVERNPADTCLSCFTRLFNRHQDATYDLAELGRHYRNYTRLMQHWRQTLPENSFMEIRYEDVVADLEGQARRLIKFCGLDWSDECLAFYRLERNVRTSSAVQVRQPIYSSSVERWRHYEKFLGPLLDELNGLISK